MIFNRPEKEMNKILEKYQAAVKMSGDDEYADMYITSVYGLELSPTEDQLKEMTKIYKEKKTEMKEICAKIYAIIRVLYYKNDAEARTMTEIFEKNMGKGRNFEDSVRYARAMMNEGLEESTEKRQKLN